MTILTVLMLMLTALLDQVQRSWRFSESRISQFREARVAFDLMAKNIGQASLNTYWDSAMDENDEVKGYEPVSELHFIVLPDAAASLPSTGTQRPVGHAVFFQAPLGFSTDFRNLNSLFNGRGYFVAYGSDAHFKPSFVKSTDRYRYRLMEFRPPAEMNQVFQDGLQEREANREQVFDEWYKQAQSGMFGRSNSTLKDSFEDHLNPLAENIITIVVAPRDSLTSADSNRDASTDIAPNYGYDSNDQARPTDPNDIYSSNAQQVPPLIRLSMVAIDEGSAIRAGTEANEPQAISQSLQGLFKRSENYAKDVETLSDRLNEKRVEHKIFSTMVMLRSSKWTPR